MWVLCCTICQEENWEVVLTGMGKDPCQEKWGVSAGYCAQLKRHKKTGNLCSEEIKGSQNTQIVLYPDVSNWPQHGGSKWLLSVLGHVTDQTIGKNARQSLIPIIWPQNPTPGIAPCDTRCCCSLQKGRRKVHSRVRWALWRTASHLRPTASVLPVLQMQIATPGRN